MHRFSLKLFMEEWKEDKYAPVLTQALHGRMERRQVCTGSHSSSSWRNGKKTSMHRFSLKLIMEEWKEDKYALVLTQALHGRMERRQVCTGSHSSSSWRNGKKTSMHRFSLKLIMEEWKEDKYAPVLTQALHGGMERRQVCTGSHSSSSWTNGKKTSMHRFSLKLFMEEWKEDKYAPVLTRALHGGIERRQVCTGSHSSSSWRNGKKTSMHRFSLKLFMEEWKEDKYAPVLTQALHGGMERRQVHTGQKEKKKEEKKGSFICREERVF